MNDLEIVAYALHRQVVKQANSSLITAHPWEDLPIQEQNYFKGLAVAAIQAIVENNIVVFSPPEKARRW